MERIKNGASMEGTYELLHSIRLWPGVQCCAGYLVSKGIPDFPNKSERSREAVVKNAKSMASRNSRTEGRKWIVSKKKIVIAASRRLESGREQLVQKFVDHCSGEDHCRSVAFSVVFMDEGEHLVLHPRHLAVSQGTTHWDSSLSAERTVGMISGGREAPDRLHQLVEQPRARKE